MSDFLDALRPDHEQVEAERLETLDPIARDVSKTMSSLLAQLKLTERQESKDPVEESIHKALEDKAWERAANLLETKADRTPSDENDFGVSLAHVADDDEGVWKDALAAFKRCIDRADACLKELAERNMVVAQQASEVPQS